MSESSDKSDLRRTVALSEELWGEIKRYTRLHPPLTIAQSIKKLVALGLHVEKFDAREYLSVNSLDEDS